MAVPTTPTGSASRFSPVTILALLAAAAVAAGGVLHVLLWDERYRTADQLPSEVPGAWVVKTGFPVNGALSILLALVLAAFAFGFIIRLGRLAVLGAIALEVGSIVALVLSNGDGFFKWTEKGDSDSSRVLRLEIAAIVLLVATLLVDMVRSRAFSDDTAGDAVRAAPAADR